MRYNGMVVFDYIFAAILGVWGLVASYGIIFKGAWWHIVGVFFCALLVIALLNDAKKERVGR